MDKYKINRKREPLTEADVKKGQNFDAFLKTYSASQKPFFKTTTFKLSIITFGIVIAIGTYFVMNSDQKNQSTISSFVHSPLAGINIADTTFKMDASVESTFFYSTGSEIRVPQNAFLDSAGNVAKGDVEIRYREFHDPAEIFIAGIPMTYDSAGTKFNFESAGMLEITACQNGKLLKANPRVPIKIDMASDNDNAKFNVYYLDTLKKNWNFIAKDKAEIVGFISDSSKKDSVNKFAANISAPIPPRKAEKEKPSIAINYLPSEFPELNAYKGIRFEVDETKTPYDKNDKKIKWEDVSIARNKDGATYAVTFTKGDLTRMYMTYAVVDEKNYDAAKKSYDKRYADYQNELNKKENAQVNNDNNLEKKLMTADAHRIFVNDTVLAWSLSRMRSRFFGSGKNAAKEDMVMREFEIQNFGIWNSDCPESLPQGDPLFVKLIDSRTKKEMPVEHLYLVEKGRNAIYTFYASDLERFQFNANAENLVWAITMDGKLAVASGDELKAMNLKTVNGKPQGELTMTVSEEKLTSVAQAKTVLGI